VLLKIVNSCAVYCRYCFRREMVGPGKAQGFGPEKLEAALAYIENTPRIWEVILTGGDPLVLTPRRLETVIRRLNAIKHVQVIRIHTRVPVADPDRITSDLCEALTSDKALYVSLHVNHAQELTEDVRSAIARLRRADCVLLSQSVLLRGVNDNVDALEDLFRQLTALRVKPYYLHHPDLARGTGHFRLPVSEGQDLMRGLKARASGLCQPHYMLDIPGGHGKVPIGPSYIENEDSARCTLRDHQGRRHSYPPSPAAAGSDTTD
jgi:lysine 2,3-aminomutase